MYGYWITEGWTGDDTSYVIGSSRNIDDEIVIATLEDWEKEELEAYDPEEDADGAEEYDPEDNVRTFPGITLRFTEYDPENGITFPDYIKDKYGRIFFKEPAQIINEKQNFYEVVYKDVVTAFFDQNTIHVEDERKVGSLKAFIKFVSNNEWRVLRLHKLEVEYELYSYRPLSNGNQKSAEIRLKIRRLEYNDIPEVNYSEFENLDTIMETEQITTDTLKLKIFKNNYDYEERLNINTRLMWNGAEHEILRFAIDSKDEHYILEVREK